MSLKRDTVFNIGIKVVLPEQANAAEWGNFTDAVDQKFADL